MPTAITDQKFNDLKAKLRELFELDKSDLDFGIYRIMAAKNREVTEFLDRQLREVVANTLAEHGVGAENAVQAELDKAISGAQALGVDPDAVPKVKELKAKLAAAGGGSAADLEADIYNHLLAFFSRYYDEGDFISQRRFKGDVYAIPYDGKEVALYWANKDQYYIKSGEWHQDFRFKVAAGKTVRFKLVAATAETNNNKESDAAKRRYILRDTDPVAVADAELTLHFEFRTPTDGEKTRAADGVVAIFGGKYATSTKGDEREQFCADAETRGLAAMSDHWRLLVQKVVSEGEGKTATESKPLRTVLGKQLDTFTAKNTFDYFIHKDLGSFLRRELDFYIKNEVIRLDDLESLSSGHLQRVQGKVKAIRTVASRVIAFLASVEEFQKKLWLKKKLVLNTHWLVTIDRIPTTLRDQVAANEKQWSTWVSLGLKPDQSPLGTPEWGTRGYLDANDKLPVDTSLFRPDFAAAVVASDEILAGKSTLEDAISGVLIHAENFQALSLIQNRYRGQIGAVYIDPPYNSDAGPIIYKNNYKSASWLTLMQDRIDLSIPLLDVESPYALAIDDYEMARLAEICDQQFGGFDRQMIIVNHHPQGGMSNNVSRTHEYMIVMTPVGSDILRGKPKSGEIEYRSFALSGPGTNKSRAGRPNSFFAVLVDESEHRIVGAEPPPVGSNYPTGKTEQGYTRRYPIAPNGEEKVWCRAYESAVDGIQNGKVVLSESGALKLAVDTKGKRSSLMSNWTDSRYNAGPHGTALVADILGDRSLFSYPKSLYTVIDAIDAMTWMNDEPTVVDFFAGSGTTGHAVINLNREDDGHRKFVLVEMGAYYRTVVKPRTAKVVYSPDWKDGKAQTHGKGISALVKCFALENYDDTLDNLPTPTIDFLPTSDSVTKLAMLQYSLDLELGPSLLSLDSFSDPWNYFINAQPAGEAESSPHRVDLAETFNYLLGLKVTAYGPIERYNAGFERAKHDEDLGRLKLKAEPGMKHAMRRDPSGPFVFQRVEGELLDGTRVLVIWRKLSDDAEKDAAVLDAWMARHREETRERTEHRDYHLIYVNGPVTLPQPTAEIRTVWPIEQTFKNRMFADDGGN